VKGGGKEVEVEEEESSNHISSFVFLFYDCRWMIVEVGLKHVTPHFLLLPFRSSYLPLEESRWLMYRWVNAACNGNYLGLNP